MVSQNVILFPTTIYENVRYGKWEASKDEIVEACKKCKIHEFIMGLPEKYDTLVGEKGILLSGGEQAEDFHCKSVFEKCTDFAIR